MSDSRPYDEQLPWLQSVEDEDEPRGISARKMLAALAVEVVAALIVAGSFFWLGRSSGSEGGAPELIRAPAGPYKVKPPNPGGLHSAADSQTAFETSAGQDTDAQLDTSKLAETGATARPPASPETKTPTSAEPKTPAPAATAPTPEPAVKATGGAGSVIQLGAFGNRTQAERAWTALSARFPNVAAMGKMIVPFPGGIRLRAAAGSAADAKQACDALKAAGENCFVAQ